MSDSEKSVGGLALKGWLGRQDPEFAAAVLSACRKRRVSNGDIIYDFGDEQAYLWSIASGYTRLFLRLNEQGPKFGHIGGPGFWFGEYEFVTGQRAIMRVVASGETSLLKISRSDFSKLATNHPDAWRAVAELAICNQATAIAAAEDLMIREPTARLVAVLLRLSSDRNAYQGESPITSVPVTQEELSLAANMSRSAGTEILAKLSDRGQIRTGYRSIQILDAEALGDLLQPPPD